MLKLWRCVRKSKLCSCSSVGLKPRSVQPLVASRLLGFSIPSSLIFGILGGNFCCHDFTVMLLKNRANKRCERSLTGCCCWRKRSTRSSTVRNMSRASRITLRFYSALWKCCRLPHWLSSCCWERTDNWFVWTQHPTALNQLFVFGGRRESRFYSCFYMWYWANPYLSLYSKEEKCSDPLVRRLKISPAVFPCESGSPISHKQMVICTSPDVSAHFAPKIVAASS